ncbi:GNAT family N-acetyltransferase [Nocardioides plantarum]|uniref:GNAT family N-acetyltransferase n=1 Tax=Nocardioides plantarum TaxID=29299 RepID=A0ABV5KC62_9ACTN|nr:GNAT family N-acetyltransferase [Nocardioides plantarum]
MLLDDPHAERQCRDDLDALPGLTWRPLGRDDLPEVAALYAECETYDANPERQSLADLEEYWDSPRSRPDEDTLLGRDEAGAAVAVAWSGCNRAVTERRGVHLGGAVRPDRRGQGIGRAVLRWQLAHGLAWDAASREDDYGPLVLRLYAPTGQDDVRDLATRHGLVVERFFFELSRRLDDIDPGTSGPVVPGVRLVGWDPTRGPELHRFVDLAFRDHWGHVDRTEEMWAEHVGSHAFRADWSVLALDEETGAVVGSAINCAWEQDWAVQGYTEGYTDELAVAASHRGRRIGSALLAESMRRFAAAGLDAAGLGVDADNASGALHLYEALGYRPTAATCVHELTRPISQPATSPARDRDASPGR